MPVRAVAGHAALPGGAGRGFVSAAVHRRGGQLLFRLPAAFGARRRGLADFMHGGEIFFAGLALVVVGGHGFAPEFKKRLLYKESKRLDHRQQHDGEQKHHRDFIDPAVEDVAVDVAVVLEIHQPLAAPGVVGHQQHQQGEFQVQPA